MPYIYAAFLRAAQTGEPVQKPLVFEFQSDGTARDREDEYLLGNDLLVVPVVKSGVTARQVYLPEGTWFDWHSGEKHAGQQFLIAATPMEQIPVFARGGAVIPMWPQAPASTANHQPQSIELHIFVPDEDGDFHSFLHEDDGLTLAFESGAFVRTYFTLSKNGAGFSLHGRVEGECYPEFARREFQLIFHGAAPATLRINGTPVLPSEGGYSLPNQGTDFLVEEFSIEAL